MEPLIFVLAPPVLVLWVKKDLMLSCTGLLKDSLAEQTLSGQFTVKSHLEPVSKTFAYKVRAPREFFR